MIVIPQLKQQGDLWLDAFSFSYDDINSVAIVLEDIGIHIISEYLDRDTRGRMGARFIMKKNEVILFEHMLQIKFEVQDEGTRARLTGGYLNFDGGTLQSYRCSRINGDDCVTIYAENRLQANLKCALIANSKNWLGGVPFPGSC
jgi:hypothetical protein